MSIKYDRNHLAPTCFHRNSLLIAHLAKSLAADFLIPCACGRHGLLLAERFRIERLAIFSTNFATHVTSVRHREDCQ